MTYEEQQEYNKLPEEIKAAYNYEKSRHPGWGHSQILAKATIGHNFDIQIENGNLDVTKKNPDGTIDVPPDLMAVILKGAKEVLLNLGIIIDSFFEAIDAALNVLGNIIEAGINYIGDKLKAFWDWLTN